MIFMVCELYLNIGLILKSDPKTLTDTSPKMIYSWQISIWKDAPHHMLSGKCKLKQWDTTTHLLEWPKSRTLTAPKAGEDVEQQELSFTSGGNAIERSL